MESNTVLITGGSRGIGAAAVRAFAQAGYAVALNYCRSRDAALRLAEELTAQGHIVLPVQADVSDPDQVRHMVDNVLDNFCQLDILICNAGTAWRGLLCDLTDQDWHRLRGTDLDGVLYCCRAVYRHMVSRKQGRILTVSSMWAALGPPARRPIPPPKRGSSASLRPWPGSLGPPASR